MYIRSITAHLGCVS